MKNWVIVLMLITVGAGCRQQDPSINQDLLYQRWRLVQIQSATGNQVIDATNADWTIT